MVAVGGPLTVAMALAGFAALVGTVVPERRIPALVAWIGSIVSALTLWASGNVLIAGRAFHAGLWTIRSIGTLTVTVDRLSALFLLVTATVFLASSVFSAAYLRRYAGRYDLRAFNAWYLLLYVSIVWVLLASDVFGFLMAWELMSITSYLLVNFEHGRESTRSAGFWMLAMGEAGFMGVALVLLFLAARSGTGEFSAFRGAARELSTASRWLVFVGSFFGFGVKAGLVPFNSWLPRAHPAAPANVSAVLSGTILNLGLYGIVRINLDLVPVDMPGAGLIVLVVGTVSALVGILYATTENDLKAVLAHSSIENVGIVTVGLGASVVFGSDGFPVLAGMALLAAFYHLINHSIYKALLFLGAGAVDDCAGTRDLDRLGGVLRGMPWTGAAFLVGALAISALPPFNGFVSEWLTLQTLLRSAELPSIGIRIAFALCGAALALTAALAVTCFVKVFAMGFLGMPRSEQAAKAKETSSPAIVPMIGLAVLCLALGVTPTYVLPAIGTQLDHLVSPYAAAALVPPFFAGSPGHDALPPAFVREFHDLGAQVGSGIVPGDGLVLLHRGGETNPVVFAAAPSYLVIVLVGLLALTALAVWAFVARRRAVVRRVVWDGGIRRLLPEMTYTATGFSNPVRVIFQAVFRPMIVEDTRATVAEHFRSAIIRETEAVHVVDRVVLQPANQLALGLARHIARMHHGRLNAYAGYVLLALLASFVGYVLL